MLSTLRSRVTYPYVVSTLALFIALGTGGAYAANEWTGHNIVDGSLTTADYKNNDIRSADIRNADKPGGGLGADDLATDSVGTNQIQTDGVNALEVADNSIDSGEISADSVLASDLATNSVGGAEVADNAIGAAEVVDNSLFAGDLASGSVGSSEIASSAVGASEVAANTISGSKVANGSLPMADIEGVDSNGAISVGAGIADGRCADLSLTIPGASVGDVVVLAVNDPVEQGMLFSGVGVRVAGQSIVKVCNFTGSSSEAIDHASITLFTLSA
jgi:hypothetical protein